MSLSHSLLPRLSHMWSRVMRRKSFAPSTGRKAVTIGQLSPFVSHPCIPRLSGTVEHTWVCSRCGQVMGILMIGSSTPTTTPSQRGS